MVLRETHDTHNVGEGELHLTLAEKGWGRGVVLVSTARNEPVSVSLGQSRLQAEAKQAEMREERLKREREVAKKREEEETARQRAIQNFHVRTR